ncbi:MAG: hypothetical protein LUD46_01600 [Parabacteroides sp.]|nr:hypothetical protein [Parabacteroides sp.]
MGLLKRFDPQVEITCDNGHDKKLPQLVLDKRLVSYSIVFYGNIKDACFVFINDTVMCCIQ